MTEKEIWQAGFDAARQWERDVESFWQDHDYGSPPLAPKNPYAIRQYFVKYDHDAEWTDDNDETYASTSLPPDTDRLAWRWKP